MKNFIQLLILSVLFLGNAFSQNLTITTTVCKSAKSVRLTGPWWNWNPTGGPEAVDNKNGTWTFTFTPAPTEAMEYLLVVDGVQENLIAEMQNGGSCAPVTDKATYANRKWLTTDGLAISNTYGKCGTCTVDELNITVEVCKPNANSVRLTGPWWNWDPNGGPVAKDQGNGVWKFTLSPKPKENMEYLVIVDGVQENLISDMQNGGTCAPVTDYSVYANRRWDVGTGDVSISYDRCVPCSYPDLNVTVQVCDSAKQVNLTGAIWSWNPAWGPQGVKNSDGTWTIKLSPAPKDTIEYLIVKDGKTENLINDMQNGGGCAPVTDYNSYANRRWIIGQGDLSITYDQCGVCLTNSLPRLNNINVSLNPNPTSSNLFIHSDELIRSLNVYGIHGELISSFNSVGKPDYQLELSKYDCGIYFIEVNTDTGNKISRIIKE
jgi:hypothetical protein